MKRVIIITVLLLTLFTACSSEGSKKVSSNLSANDYTEKLKTANLPIGEIVIYTAETDPNKLLGRPNQYTSKVNFEDTTLEQSDSNNPEGGSIEIFKTAKDAQARKDYIDSIGKQSSLFAEYSYLKGNVLLRLSNTLTPDQAKKYESEFIKIK